MFGEFAQYIWALMYYRDRQQGKALGYEDANMNLHWDPGEVLTFRDLRLDLGDLDIEFKIEYYQALDIAALCSALEANLLYEVPFHIDLVKNVLGGYDLWWLNLLIDLFLDDLLVDGMVDISPIFTDPQPEGARPLIISLAEALKQLQ